MDKKCEVIRDLLPPFLDELCSNVSKSIIKKHLNSCDSCATILNNMKNEISITSDLVQTDRLKAKKPFKQLKNVLVLSVRRAVLLGFAFILVNIGYLYYINNQKSAYEVRLLQSDLAIFEMISRGVDYSLSFQNEDFLLMFDTYNHQYLPSSEHIRETHRKSLDTIITYLYRNDWEYPETQELIKEISLFHNDLLEIINHGASVYERKEFIASELQKIENKILQR